MMVNLVGSRDDPNRWKPEGMRDHLTLGELARLVERDRSRIIQLEKGGKIVSPVRVKVGRLMVRLYSPSDVREIVEHFHRVARTNPKGGPGA